MCSIASTPFTASSNAPSCQIAGNQSLCVNKLENTHLGEILYNHELELVTIALEYFH